jgi:hypothetical protein
MEFKCICCNYATCDKFNYQRHLKSNKHKLKDLKLDKGSLEKPKKYSKIVLSNQGKNNLLCEYCKQKYATSGSLARHKKICSEKNSEIELLKKENEMLKTLFDEKEDKISILKAEVAHLKSIVNNTGSMVKTSISTMAFVIKNFREAPALELVTDCSALHYEQNTNQFVEEIIHQFDHDKLDAYIGDFIVKNYKKVDPSKQSIWNSDTNRLTYLIRELLNNKVDWKVDKKGIKTKKFIIEPILGYIDDQIREYIHTLDIDYDSISAKDAERKMMKIKSATNILKDIEDKILCDHILKYITPYFYLNKIDDNISEV